MDFKKIIFNKKTIAILSVLILFIIIEFSFDVIEIIVGELVELTNSQRPKSGTVWELNKKGSKADLSLQQITESDYHYLNQENQELLLENLIKISKSNLHTTNQMAILLSHQLKQQT